MGSTSRMHGTHFEKKKLTSGGLPSRLFEVTRLPARSFRSKAGINVTGGYGEAQAGVPLSFTLRVTAEPSAARSTSARAPVLPMAAVKPVKSSARQSVSR